MLDRCAIAREIAEDIERQKCSTDSKECTAAMEIGNAIISRECSEITRNIVNNYIVTKTIGTKSKIYDTLDCIKNQNCDEMSFNIAIIGGSCTGKTKLWETIAPYLNRLLDKRTPDSKGYVLPDDEEGYRFSPQVERHTGRKVNVYTAHRVPYEAFTNRDVLIRVTRKKDKILQCLTKERPLRLRDEKAIDIYESEEENINKLERTWIAELRPAAVIYLYSSM